MIVTPERFCFGARVTGVDLAQPLSDAHLQDLRAAWLAHQVLYFPGQDLRLQGLERFARLWGEPGDDPFVAAKPGHPNIIEVKREANEAASPFGSSWHSDWSFQACPPSATMLLANTVPPYGGDTLFADGYRAFKALDRSTQAYLRSLTAIHSARRPYTHAGFMAGGGAARTMEIHPSDEALATQTHPVVRTHPETGLEALWVNPVYTIGIEGMTDADAQALIRRLCQHATAARFTYRLRWSPGMLAIWDNRTVQHCAQGGYDGHRRLMYRTTIAGCIPS